MASRDDRGVELKGSHLNGKTIDFIMTGGIGCVEAPKAVRELRRFGAEVRVFMTGSAQKFVTELVMEWASANGVVTEISGKAEHISNADAAVVYPCSLDFMSKIAHGLADSAALTNLQSLLGRKPVIVQPSMHQSLMESPSYQQAVLKLQQIDKLYLHRGAFEEQKLKASDPISLAAVVCHAVNQPTENKRRALVMCGPTRTYLDEVRYLSNYSSGALGREIADDLYRRGVGVEMVAGPVQVSLPSYIPCQMILTNQELEQAVSKLLDRNQYDVIYFASAVLDFEAQKKPGKMSSSNEAWQLELQPSKKLIESLGKTVAVRVGFKLETAKSEEQVINEIKEWNKTKRCHLIVANLLENVGPSKHEAIIYHPKSEKSVKANTKVGVARQLNSLVVAAFEA